jgi:hypothetical protein
VEVSYVMKDPQKSPWLFQYNESWSFISWISSMVWGTPILGNLHIYIYDSIYDHMYIYNYIYIISIYQKKNKNDATWSLGLDSRTRGSSVADPPESPRSWSVGSLRGPRRRWCSPGFTKGPVNMGISWDFTIIYGGFEGCSWLF